MRTHRAAPLVSYGPDGRITGIHPKPDLESIEMSATAVVAFLLGIPVRRDKSARWQADLAETDSLDIEVFPEAAEATIKVCLAADVAADIWLRRDPAFSPFSISLEEPTQHGHVLLRAARQLGYKGWDASYEALARRYDALASTLRKPRLWVAVVLLAANMRQAERLTSRMVTRIVRGALLGDNDHSRSIWSPALYADESECNEPPAHMDPTTIAQMIARRLRKVRPNQALSAAHDVERARYSLGEAQDLQTNSVRQMLQQIEDSLRGTGLTHGTGGEPTDRNG